VDEFQLIELVWKFSECKILPKIISEIDEISIGNWNEETLSEDAVNARL